MRRAFALVEIFIVIVILAILAAIVIPQFTAASDAEKARRIAATQPATQPIHTCKGCEHETPAQTRP